MTKTRNAKYQKKYKRKYKLIAYGMLGGECVRCGFDDIRALQIDHVNDDGHEEKVPRDAQYYKKVATNKGNRYQILCSNCNQIKRCEHRDEN